jgi:FkbM family methyltransferase
VNNFNFPVNSKSIPGGRPPSVLHRIARYIGTRFNGVKGVDRLLRAIHDPDKRQKSWIATVEPAYPQGPRYHLESRWFTEWQVLFYGRQDKDIHRWIVDRVKPEWVAFDIGANFGYYSCLIASLCSKVHAFEPVSWLADRVEANAILNKLTNLTVNRMGLSDISGLAKLNLPDVLDGNWGTSSLVRRPASNRGQFSEVTLGTLDEYCDATASRMDFVKIDVEGAEDLVLRGGRRSIEKWRPYMVIECNRESAANVLQLLASMRYRFIPLRGEKVDIISMPFTDILAEPLEVVSG